MFFFKNILPLLSLIMLASITTVHGDGTTDDVCLEEMAAYQACAISSQNCDSACENVNQDPEFTEEEILQMLTDPNFMCKWFNEVFCAVQQCCNECNDEAGKYFSCLAAQSTDDGNCEFTCTGNTDNDGNVTVIEDSNNNVNGTVTGGSSASPFLSKMTAWTGLVTMVGYALI